MTQSKFPQEWDEERVRRVLTHYEDQTEEEAVAEDEHGETIMKALILAAGYAKRLYPHIRNIPKPLLPIAKKPLIELILSRIGEVDEIEEVLIVTNELYLKPFQKWEEGFTFPKKIKIISDGTKSNQERKGAIGDLHFIVEREKINTDLLVIAGDNFFEFNLQDFLKEFKAKRKAIIALHELKDPEKLSKRFGVVELHNNKIVGFEEKPEIPKTSLASTLCYVLTQKELNSLKIYIEKYPKADDAGNFIKQGLSRVLKNTNPQNGN